IVVYYSRNPRHRHSLPTRRSSDLFPGIAAVRQTALDAAEDDELAVMIDDDVMPEPGWLRGLLTVWNESHATAVVGYVRYVWPTEDRKSTRLNSSHVKISYAVFCLK